MCVTETPMSYSRMDVPMGETLSLTCNTSADIMWTYSTVDTDGLVSYIYWNRLIDSDKPRLSVNSTAAGDAHSLVISRVQLSDRGLYDCYTSTGQRAVGYQLTVVGMCHCAVACSVLDRLGVLSDYVELSYNQFLPSVL